jgi:hypothetical protein
VLAIRRYFALIAGAKCLRCAASADRDLATENYDPNVEVMRMHVLRKVGFLATVNDLKALAA